MSIEEIIRAWKDEAYRNSLTPEQREQLLPNPAGVVEIEDEALDEAAGGTPSTYGLCTYVRTGCSFNCTIEGCSFFTACSYYCTYTCSAWYPCVANK
jgi:mersacidin/lichenicidin family type 2 lantibiotic